MGGRVRVRFIFSVSMTVRVRVQVSMTVRVRVRVSMRWAQRSLSTNSIHVYDTPDIKYIHIAEQAYRG